MGYKQYCKEPEKIENYEKAKKDNFKGWECHHRLETHTSDGERRLVDITKKELKALGMYYNRPPEELIFLTRSEHHEYRKGKKRSEETRKKIGAGHKGKKLSAEHKKKLREAHLGQIPWNKGKHTQPRSEETKNKIKEAMKGKQAGEKHPAFGTRWFNNGEKCVRAKECPPGFVPGRLLI